MTEPAAVRAEGLCVRVGRRRLIENASFSIRAGEVVLVAGPSGSGKSVLLRLIGGLITGETPGFRIGGSLSVVEGEGVGLVFQDFALFTGMTARRNIGFAVDHRRDPVSGEERDAVVSDLLAELEIDGDARVAELSGGQRQRVAIARALAYAPQILAYDEPTSGLDPAMRDRVAERIRRTSREHGTTTVIVTHDVAGLVGIADRVLLLDPGARDLVEVPAAEAEKRLIALSVPPALPPRVPPLARRLGKGVAAFLDGTARTVLALAVALFHLLPRFRSWRWGLRFLRHYFTAVAGPGALVYFLLSGAVIGLVSTYFVFTFLPRKEVTEALILDDMVGGLGFGLHRILVPLIMTILLAARAGSAVAADVSTRVAGRQTDAMLSLGAVPSRYLLTGTLWAFLLGTPLLALVSFVGARIASAGVFAAMSPELSLFAWHDMFHRLMTAPGALLPTGTDWVLAKNLTSAFGIASIAYFQGARPKDSPEEVAQSITRTVIWATFLVLAVHVIYALIEF